MIDRERLRQLLNVEPPAITLTARDTEERDGWTLERLRFRARRQGACARFPRAADRSGATPAILYGHAHGGRFDARDRAPGPLPGPVGCWCSSPARRWHSSESPARQSARGRRTGSLEGPSAGRSNAGPARRDPASCGDGYFRCLLTSFVISNMFTVALPPKTDLQRRVGLDHALVLGVLELVLLDVGPELLGDFGAGDRLGADDLGERGARRTGFMNAAEGFRAVFLAVFLAAAFTLVFPAVFFAVLAICSPFGGLQDADSARGAE